MKNGKHHQPTNLLGVASDGIVVNMVADLVDCEFEFEHSRWSRISRWGWEFCGWNNLEDMSS